MNNNGTNQAAPIVHNGVLFINNPGNIVQALDARTGNLIWENRIGDNDTGSSQRGLAMFEDKIYITTGEAHIYALDARTGKNVWDTAIGDRTKYSYSTSSGPLIAKGKVIQGLGGQGCSYYHDEKCFISAYDARTGKLLWKFYTIAKTGELGGDTWGTLPDLFRVGAETWITGSYDPDLNLTYWGTAQAKPWMRPSRGSGGGSTLFANSTVALDVDTGKLKWYFNHAPGESVKPASSGSWTVPMENISDTRKVSSRISTIPSIRRRASRIIATTSWNKESANGYRAAPLPKAARTGTP